MNKQHVQVPIMEINQSLLFSDPYVYACIKKYMNKTTKQAFPSVATLVKDSGLNKKTILAAIDRLEKEGYIKIEKKHGAKNIYQFNDYTKFEIFSYDFLENPNLSPKAKSYLVILQHEMKKDPVTGIGNIQYNRVQIAEKLGISQPTLRKIETELLDSQILSFTETNTLELMKTPTGEIIPLTGLKNCIRSYDFSVMLNAIALQFLKQGKEIKETKEITIQTQIETQQNTEDIKKHDARIAELESQVANYKKMIEELTQKQ